eukprot:SM000205S06234  [mRNA]  locus=s205:122752:123746:- [translate_table: standard]
MATPISSKYDRVQKPTKVCAVDHLKLLEEGITRATRMHHLLRLVIDLHVALEVAVSKDDVGLFCELAEMLKAGY